jgi:predicted nucleotidyltransferase
MPLPDFDSVGDLPEGVYQATMDEIRARFGHGTSQRQAVTARLLRIYHLAAATGKLERVIIFGSYITTKPDPNDVDVVLVMSDDFEVQACDKATRRVFDHTQATEEFGASIFWLRPSMLFLETLEEFIEHWQIKRDLTRRGIVEVRL